MLVKCSDHSYWTAAGMSFG